ncbi:hypothetical protein ACOBQJ_11365 [Pelotomaculum propionicicum]|uniref:hypothetical protein n=1 Tax=Pelotomaculum propionicicum TaxID=258475 RepID=UPI003B7FFEA0
MKVYVSVKQAGKRKEYITKKELILENAPLNLRGLITEVVRINVTAYNNKTAGPLIIKYLSPAEIEDQAETGKVGFGERRSHEQADVYRAIETAVLAFEDGIYRVFIGENEISSLDEPLEINENGLLTFIRFTMLAGRMW